MLPTDFQVFPLRPPVSPSSLEARNRLQLPLLQLVALLVGGELSAPLAGDGQRARRGRSFPDHRFQKRRHLRRSRAQRRVP